MAIQQASKVLRTNDRVTITAPDDDGDVMHSGHVVTVNGSWIGIRIDGEQRVDEWPIEQVWRA